MKSIQLVRAICEKVLDGYLPARSSDVRFVGMCIEVFAPDAPPEIQQAFGFQICEALHILRESRGWMN